MLSLSVYMFGSGFARLGLGIIPIHFVIIAFTESKGLMAFNVTLLQKLDLVGEGATYRNPGV